MRKLKWTALFVFVVFVIFGCLFLARRPILKSLGSFLVVQDELKKTDVIIVLGGENDRVEEAARLYKQGLAPYILMTGKMVAYGMKRSAVRSGVPAEDILVEPEAASTYQHPIYVKPIIEEKGFKSAIVVSSPYHMRRSAMLFDRALKKDKIELIYYPVQDGWFDADNWWTTAVGRRAVKMEYAKLAVNVWGVGLSEFVLNLVEKNK